MDLINQSILNLAVNTAALAILFGIFFRLGKITSDIKTLFATDKYFHGKIATLEKRK